MASKVNLYHNKIKEKFLNKKIKKIHKVSNRSLSELHIRFILFE